MLRHHMTVSVASASSANCPWTNAGDCGTRLSSRLHRLAVPLHHHWSSPHLPVESHDGTWHWHLQQPGLWDHHSAGPICLGSHPWVPACVERCEGLLVKASSWHTLCASPATLLSRSSALFLLGMQGHQACMQYLPVKLKHNCARRSLLHLMQ